VNGLIDEGPADRIVKMHSRCSREFHEYSKMIAGVKISVSSRFTCHIFTARVYDGDIAKVLVLSACPSFSSIQYKV